MRASHINLHKDVVITASICFMLCLALCRELSLTDINQLPVLNAVIKESLRVLPPASLGTFRKTKVETEVRD